MTDRPEALLPLPPATFHILLSLADEDRHGYGIILDVVARTNGELKLSAGTLYRSIQRMPARDRGPSASCHSCRSLSCHAC